MEFFCVLVLVIIKDKFSNNQLSEALKFSYDKGKLDMFKQLLTLEEVNPTVDNNYCFNKAYMSFKDDYMDSLLENKMVRDFIEKNKPDVFKEVMDGRTIQNQDRCYYQANTNTTFVPDPRITKSIKSSAYFHEFGHAIDFVNDRTPISINEYDQLIQAQKNKSKIKANLNNFFDEPELVNKTIAAITVENKFTDFSMVEEGVVLRIPTLKKINSFVISKENPIEKCTNSPITPLENQSSKKKLKF